MAMTKAEQRELKDVRDLADLHRALRWSDPTENDLLPDIPPVLVGYTEGWELCTYDSTVRRAWSEGHAHGPGAWSPPSRSRSASQGGIALYSTEERALRAARRLVEVDSARRLFRIDAKIAAARASTDG